MYNKLIDLDFPYHPGFHAYSTAGKNSCPPILSTRDMEDLLVSLVPNSPPEQIKLMVRLAPHKMPHNPLIQMRDQGRAYAPFVLMDPAYFENPDFLRQGGYKSIDILYAGAGEAFYQGTTYKFEGLHLLSYGLELPPILYHKEFTCFEEEVLSQDYEQYADGYLVSPCSIRNAWPRYPFGGFYDQGAPLEHLAPLYFSVGFDAKSRPQITVETTQEFVQAGVTPPHSGLIHGQQAVFIMGGVNMQQISLAENINQGGIQIYLYRVGLDSEGMSYISVGYEQSQEGIWICFEPDA